MKLVINGSPMTINEPKRIIDLIDNKDFKYMAANVNNRCRELNYIVKDDAEIELLGLDSSIVTNIYQATLRYVVVMAIKNLYPKAPFEESDFASKYNESYEGFQTVSNTATESCYTIDRLHKFNYANDIENHYEDVKLTFVMWLEGWDADYFDGIDSPEDFDPSQFKVNLNFIVKRSND